MTEEVKNVDMETGEIKNELAMDNVVRETENYVIRKENGKFVKQAKYKKIFTHVPQTEEKQIELYNVFNSSEDDNDLVQPIGKLVGEVIGIDELYTNPYTSFDEETGQDNYGVTTTIKDGEQYYVTSSKSVYYTVQKLFETFGNPADEDYKKIYVKVTGTKRQNGVQIDFALSHLGE